MAVGGVLWEKKNVADAGSDHGNCEMIDYNYRSLYESTHTPICRFCFTAFSRALALLISNSSSSEFVASATPSSRQTVASANSNSSQARLPKRSNSASNGLTRFLLGFAGVDLVDAELHVSAEPQSDVASLHSENDSSSSRLRSALRVLLSRTISDGHSSKLAAFSFSLSDFTF
ncbi:unnamed protein product [Phytophthora fragariaefolia]|uniref:Unnamed protein product n=1 Tax=Phytophthora fragariaefolia TaxID=1490495 RepID=A0A9W6UB41_9STRA|nr:unnamed protein product [Phytophthora fragariaefolia]